MNPSLTLVLPGLIWPHPQPLPALHLPALDTLRRWSTRTHGQSDVYRRFLWHGTIGAALGAAEPVLLCSPVSQTVGLHHTPFLSGSLLPIRYDEAETLCQTLNGFFCRDGITFTPATPLLWLVSGCASWSFEAADLWQLYGSFGKDSKPQGRDAPRVLQMLTECQMLLHDHPLNRTRAQHGLPPVNGVWLQNDRAGNAVREQCLFSDSTWAPHAFRLPESFPALIPDMPPHGSCVVFSEHIAEAANAADAFAYAERLHAWEQNWFAPVCQSLRSGSLKSVEIHTQGCDENGECRVWQLAVRKPRLPLWRRHRPFNGQNL